jgi:HD domain
MTDASRVPGTTHESRRASATRDPRIGTDAFEHNGNGNGNGNGHSSTRATGLLADEPLQLSPARVPSDPARRAAMELASAVIVASSAETASHSDDVDVLSEAICRRLALPAFEWEDVVIAARLHDIGKIEIPPALLEKPGPLNDAEWAAVHRHTIVGEEIVAAVPELEDVAKLVRHSHERWDGGGYPDGIAGDRIPLGSRIIACADAYHAMRSDRPYRKGRSAAAALVELRACAGTQFDPAVVTAFEQVARGYRGRVPRRLNGRTARLMALLLIVGVGVTGSAIARSGLLGDPGPANGAVGASGASSLGVNQLGPPFSTNPGHRNPPGVRDHGAGVGAGKGQGSRHRNQHGKGKSGHANSHGWSGQGQSASAPGHGGSSPGKSEFAPGHGSSPGNSASAAGHTGSAGSSGSSGGHSHVATSHVKAPPPSPPPAPPANSNAGGNGGSVGGSDGGGKGH